jgi:ABC-2 type transport system ATP-binding protein
MNGSSVPALALDGLTKRYGDRAVVQGLSLRVAPGQVYGFLGPNGAGKTTTIRMALGLVRPSAGSVQIFGQDPRAVPAARHHVGLMVELSAFYPHLTGAENLRVLAYVRGVDPARIDQVLATVGLTDQPRTRFRHYSTGMQARLGIAAALLHDPALLILDEPANGLDPLGMAELRALLSTLTREGGKTVFISSHLLTEIEQSCERVAILNKGQLVAEGAVADLLGGLARYEFQVDAGARAAALLEPQFGPAEWVSGVSGAPDRLLITCPQGAVPMAVTALVGAGIQIYAIAPQHKPLEALFLELTGGVARDA